MSFPSRLPHSKNKQLYELEAQFDEFLAQVEAEITPEQAARIMAKREQLRRLRGLLPGSNCEILPSSN
jgi:hypothetical protein